MRNYDFNLPFEWILEVPPHPQIQLMLGLWIVITLAVKLSVLLLKEKRVRVNSLFASIGWMARIERRDDLKMVFIFHWLNAELIYYNFTTQVEHSGKIFLYFNEKRSGSTLEVWRLSTHVYVVLLAYVLFTFWISSCNTRFYYFL